MTFLTILLAAASPPARGAAQPNSGGDVTWILWIVAAFGLILGIIALVLYAYSLRRGATGGRSGVSDQNLEGLRIVYGFWLIIAGLLLTLAVAILALLTIKPGQNNITTADVVAVITSVTGVIGTLIAAFFGIQAAGAGRTQAISALTELQSQGAGGQSNFQMKPSSGPAAGNTVVTITGSGLTGTSEVNFGTKAGTNFEFTNDGLLRVTTPAAPDGTYRADVTLVYPDPAKKNVLIGTYTYYDIKPSSGAQGTQVTIHGDGFSGATGVVFGTEQATNVKVVDNNTITAQAPTGASGSNALVNVVYPVTSATNHAAVGTFHYN